MEGPSITKERKPEKKKANGSKTKKKKTAVRGKSNPQGPWKNPRTPQILPREGKMHDHEQKSSSKWVFERKIEKEKGKTRGFNKKEKLNLKSRVCR